MRVAVKKDLAAFGGFTLVEVCIVSIISGLIFVAMFDLYSRYAQQQEKATTIANLEATASEISNFYNIQNRYPCPADRTLAFNNANFGQEVDPTAGLTGSCDLKALGLQPGKCISGGVVTNAFTDGVGGVCMFDCSTFPAAGITACGDKTGVDTYKWPDPVLGPNSNYKNVVVIGGIPITTIRAAEGAKSGNNTAIIFDAWGSQIDYVVTYSLTRTSNPPGAEGTYKFDRGAITIHDENGNDTAGSVNNAHYGMISHGQDRIGAYTRNGQMSATCGTHVPQSYFTGDDQNCSNNATFIQGIRNDSRTALHYDDLTYFVVITSGGLWQQLANGDMVNVNQGLVNIGTAAAAPAATVALKVGDPAGGATLGIVHADNTANPTAAGVKAAQLCDRDTATGCFPVKNIVSAIPIITCPPVGQPTKTIMRGITNGVADCVAPSFSALIPNQTCPGAPATDHWVVGIATDGHIICN